MPSWLLSGDHLHSNFCGIDTYKVASFSLLSRVRVAHSWRVCLDCVIDTRVSNGLTIGDWNCGCQAEANADSLAGMTNKGKH